MPKVINTELLDQLGRPNEMVDEMLDRQIETLETQLGLRAKGVGNRVLSMFLVNGTRVQLSESSIQRELQRQIQLDPATTTRIIKELGDAGILRITSAGRYEIANSFLARRAFQKVESENRVLRTIRATIQDRMSREELLDRQYLNYIDTSLPLIDLTPEETAFIQRSRENVRRRRRRINWIVAGAFLLVLAMAVNTYFNYQSAQSNNEEFQQANEELNKSRAEERRLREEAQEALEQAREAKEAADAAREEAEEAQESAEISALEAEQQRVLADSLRQEAVQDRNRILAQAEKLQELTEQAQRDANRNKALREQAEASEKLAQDALDRSETLNRIITSWNAASRALQIEDARIKTLVTLEAYKLNRDNPAVGDVYHPNIVRALLDAASSFDEDLEFDIATAHDGAVRDIVLHPDGNQFFTTGSDGQIRQWRIQSWNSLGVPELASPRNFDAQPDVVYNQLSVSADGKRLLAAGESRDFHVFHAPDGASVGSVPVEPQDEIFTSGFANSGDFLAAGLDHFFRYDAAGRNLESFPKNRSNKSLIIKDKNGTSVFSVQGQYQEFAYELLIDSLGDGKVGRQEINFYGTPKEVDYGAVAKVDYGQLNDSVALLVIGFTSGRVMFIETNANGDHFLPRSADARKDFKPHQAAISDFAFSNDGKKLAMASYDGTVSVWDLERYADPSYQPVVFDRHPTWVLSVTFAKSDEYIITGCQDGSLHFWNVRPVDYAEFLCEELEATGNAALQQQRKLESISRKSGLIRAFDELSNEDYRRYFGEGTTRRITRSIRVCN
ncbi:WD40 repeat domain-containing protein [Flavilitoribacter nigricans]|uniref:WD40 repeat domain-containing protein n=1 Tax=Flavilitoribacter nigricans (strain ATCC 23147 / DSM 23189 / NBRC 102662 / NCIMB 1420 / SS-2) TaxID=1122177 RepID=A0A2D0NGI6_FLAN2|nr:WD40 repeat domain-containing protein [Flavilitoribacter nigricans]PHN07528.1 hypothetical protein CRP01_05350 [Flavilitoribacter nigricans DSM 23189 = NBRC 102662]